ncbi:MAG: glycerophosphodiester phosphodiesterase family protein [Saprospiraceae bacterium]
MKVVIWCLLLLTYISGCRTHQVEITKIPDVQGHRGCRGLMPENTIPAFIEAVKLGVTTLELDVVMNKFGDVIISHEPYYNSYFSTDPLGHPIKKSDEKKHNLYQMTFDEIASYDVGMRTNPKYPLQSKIACYKPKLDDVVDTVRKYCMAQKLPLVMFNIELKYDRNEIGTFFPKDSILIDSVFSILKNQNLLDNAIIQSFDTEILNICYYKEPNLSYALLIDNSEDLQKNLSLLHFKPSVYSPRYTKVNKKLVTECRVLDLKIIPWTVNDEDDIVEMLGFGVDGIISDYPDKVIEIAEGLLQSVQ